MTDTAVQRYMRLADRGYQDDAAYEELVALFAPDAVVDIDGTPVRGTAEIRAFYRRFFDEGSESSHYWYTEILPDGTHRTVWVESGRLADGRLTSVAGVEYATLDADGRIATLRNEPIQQFHSEPPPVTSTQ
jgi:hypothetical protein